MKIEVALLAGVSVVMLHGTGLAENKKTTRLEAIVVTGKEDPTAPVGGYVAKSSATGTKTGTPILETQQSISVITRDQIEDRGAKNLGQALSTTAGVIGEPYGADPRFDSPVLRGFDMSNAEYLNGLRLMRSSGAPSYDIYGLERVEVLKGPSSVLYGSGSPAGIINMVQKHAQTQDSNEAGAGFSADGDKEIFYDGNKALSDTFAARLTARISHTQEDISDLTNTRGYLGLATRWAPTDTTTFNILGSYQKDSPITPAGVPYQMTGQDNDRKWRDLYIGDPNFDRSDRQMTNIGYEFHHEFDGGWSLDQSARYQKFDWNYAGFYASGYTAPSTINRGVVYENENTWTANFDTRLSGEVDTGPLSHKLLFGVDLRQYDDKTTSQFATSSSLDLANPSSQSALVGSPWYTLKKDLVLKQAGIYAQDELSLDNWHATLALRHDWTDQKGTSTNNFSGTTNINQQDQATTGHAGLSYVFSNGLAPYLSYSTSFDPDIGADIDGKQLKPTTGEQWEVGLKYQPTSFAGLFSIAFYDLRQKNVGVTVTEGGISGTRQIGQVRSRGIELEGAAEIGDGWTLKAAYSYNDAKQIGSNDGKLPANMPRHSGSLWLNYQFAETSTLHGLSLGGGVRYVGARYGDNANTYALSPVTVLDLAAKYDFNKNAALSLNVNNLTDVAYVSNCGSFGCYYGAGRSVMGRLTFKW